MSEYYYHLSPEPIAKINFRNIPGQPDFKWTPSPLPPHSLQFQADSGPELASYVLPFEVTRSERFNWLGYVNPKFGLLDVVGGRLDFRFEWREQTLLAAIRESKEEVGKMTCLIEYPIDPIFWLLNNHAHTFAPVYISPALSNDLLVNLQPAMLSEQIATHRLLSILYAVKQLGCQ